MAQADIELKRNDTRPLIDAVLSDADGPVDLTGATVKFFVQDSDGGTVISQTSTGAFVTIQNATAGSVRYSPQSSDTATSGYFKAEWEVSFLGGTKATFPNDGYSIMLIHDDLDAT